MKLVNYLKSSVNYTTLSLSQGAKNVATNPPALDKVLRLAIETFALFDLHHFGKIQTRQVTDAMKGSIELLEFYTTFTDILFFICPPSDPEQARPITLMFSTACFTLVDIGSNMLTLNKWGLIDLSKIAAQIGNQSRVFLFVVNLGAETVLGTLASVALLVSLSEASYRAVLGAYQYYHAANPESNQLAYQRLREALIDMLSSGADLVEAASPLLFTLNPPALAGLAIFAKVTGLTCMFAR